MWVCSSLLIRVCMSILSKALLTSCATVIVCAGGPICLNPFATVLFNVCSAVTVECCVLYPCCVGVFGMFAVMQRRRLFSSVFAISERRDMGLYELSISLLGFWMGARLANFHMCGIMLVLRAVFNMLLRNASPRESMCFRNLMFSLSGPVICYFCFVLLPLGVELW